MQLSIATTTQSTSILTTSTKSGASGKADEGSTDGNKALAAAPSVLEAASKKAQEDAGVIAALQTAVQMGRGESDAESERKALAKVEDYQKTAGRLKTALGLEETSTSSSTNTSYESATISTTTLEAEIGGNTVSAKFVSYDRISYDSATGLSARSASATNIEANVGNASASYQSASVSSLYAGTGNQVGNLIAGLA
ncbi:hypothetical protein [Roseibium algae]|uniref:Flagellin N-terminal domain-containing protein n=1 Tax=Roseibium algae TaxID=3123038 RepID=A0ABU8TPZ3_9HYPH